MTLRRCVSLALFLLSLPLVLSLAGCSSLLAIQVLPGTGTATLSAAGQTVQFTAVGANQMGSSNPTSSNITNSVTWSVSNPAVATISSTGLATATGPGHTIVSAQMNGLVATSDLTVTIPAGTGTGSGVTTSISIIPNSQTVSSPGQTSQFIAIGTNASGATVNLGGQVAWSSSSTQIATIDPSSGLATAVAQGTTTITAIYTNPSSGSVLAGTATFTVSSGTSAKYSAVTVTPGSQTVATPGQTGQFLAIGTGSNGATTNLSGQVSWSSSSRQIATIDPSSGLATAVGPGTATITAIYSGATGGAVVTGSATFTVTAGTAEKYTAVTIDPGSQALSASGQTGQFIALATSAGGLATDVTSSPQIKWISSTPSIATVSGTGLVTGLNAGSTTITAELANADGTLVSSTATVAVSITAAPEPLLSLAIIPSTISVGNLQDTGQFLAIGTFSTPPTVRDLTNSPSLTWISSAPNVFPVSTNSAGSPGASAGTVTAYGNGTAVIIAEATSSDGTIQTAVATFNCPLVLPTPTTAGSCYTGSQAPSLLSTLTIYNAGLNTAGWLITVPSATGTPNVIHCGPASTTGGSVCEASYPVGTTVTVTAPAEAGVNFGGWTNNCTPTLPVTAAGPNACSVTLTTNDTVGAIFN